MSDQNLIAPFPPTARRPLEQTVLDRTYIGPPYFDLRPVSWQGGVFGAQAELSEDDAVGLCLQTQMLRQACLAGMCVGTLTQPDDRRRHYIVQEAHYVVQPHVAPGTVELSARVIDLDQRSLRAEVLVSGGAGLLASLNVLYTVLSGEAFARLFARRPVTGSGGPPEWTRPLPGGTLTRRGDRLIREVDTLPAEACAGTRLGVRALPTSVLVGHLTALVGELEGQSGRLASVGLRVGDLCWAGENLCFEVRPQDAQAQEGAAYVGSVHAGPNRRLVARAQLVMARP